ncbi:polymer-forming cytoskeletal protein [Paenibacillus thiaminolyticus]|uniref:Polymer-forming cytoskeletal protein n=1 Tax=Paenibacillus thiaminolyticus TaxID=49283 RepID=A0AAP9DXP0_PANTH|nr:polymer-forming cytoskeletal protein [Paenibacillus thiaminolyticus]MCY9533768.1 polymer-forming cytoskeletal protein [Paenibacillus thiaminolyticus]MCY9600259.1 polymer-forming cytoskeletal protein [Paenibacillus thiaminolyticus]MCY9607819.1 polymer-forming cytoskeletal protein [Paenibacillus thiaminolyticus]MCY9611928.1 polymer-forming cytoskeletal protein [Paenibacillus thiaminolyticus]MCY9617852.1 polymer-forming cytoskeletal protein [Paenibacillus thiaminolyticus]
MFQRSSQRIKPTDTFIGHGTDMNGTIYSQTNVRIDGKFTGELSSSGTITIGERGEAHSTLTARHVVVAGTVVGDIKTTGKLLITSSGQVLGHCESGLLVVEEGGILNGTSMVEREAREGAAAVHEPPGREREEKKDDKADIAEKQAG